MDVRTHGTCVSGGTPVIYKHIDIWDEFKCGSGMVVIHLSGCAWLRLGHSEWRFNPEVGEGIFDNMY